MENNRQYCGFPGSTPILVKPSGVGDMGLNVPHSKKPFSPWHIRAVGHPIQSH